MVGGLGDDTLTGGEGTDTAVYSGNRAAYTISESGGVITVIGPDGTDSLTNVERLQFADVTTDAVGNPLSGAATGTAKASIFGAGLGADSDSDTGPQTLPSPGDAFPSLADEVLSQPGFALDEEVMATGSLSETLLTHDGYLIGVEKGGGDVQVLPAADDDFVLTGKFGEVPAVLPLVDDLDPSVLPADMAGDFMISLASEEPLFGTGDSLTLLDEWSGKGASPKDDFWG